MNISSFWFPLTSMHKGEMIEMSNLDTLQKILTEHRSKLYNVSTPFLSLCETHKGIIAL